MLARRSALDHPRVGRIELPLLVPAFSSKGFGLRTTGRGSSARIYSEIAYELVDFGERPSTAVLVSAYDLFFRHFEAPKLPHRPEHYLQNSTVVLLDSGGYELISQFDSTETRIFPYTPRGGYGLQQYETVLQQLTSDKLGLPLVIANFDYDTTGQPIDKQISAARPLFNKYRSCLSDFIIKPPQDRGSVDPSRLSRSDLANLRGFNIIGVTEKDLGRDIFERLRRVAELRHRLDDAGIIAPIHVWGGLDPLLSPLFFFFAGAEILDGVSWMRYAYRNGVAMERQSSAILKEIGVTASQKVTHLYAALDNLTFLNSLTIALQQWVDFDGNDFSMFHGDVRQDLQRAYIAMKTRIKELGGSR